MGCCKKSDPADMFPSGNNVNGSRRHIDEKAPCCCCCACCPGGCTKRAATLAFGFIGLILAASIIVPPIYIYTTQGGQEGDYTILFPMLKYGRQYLDMITKDQYSQESQTISTIASSQNNSIESAKTTPNDDIIANITPKQKYRLAIFQLLDDTENMAPCMAFFSFVMGCANVPLNIFLIAGACWRKSCLIMPWLVITLLEHLIVGVPLIVFMGLISLYLAAQLHLYIQATILIGFIVTLFFLSLSSWFTVYSCYQLFNEDHYNYRSGDGANGGSYDYGADCQSTQPLMNASDQPPPLPDGHPHFSGQPGYPMGGGHPQVSYSNQYPSAPPPSGMYPSLNA